MLCSVCYVALIPFTPTRSFCIDVYKFKVTWDVDSIHRDVTLTLCDRKLRRFKHNQWTEPICSKTHSTQCICVQFRIYRQPNLTCFLMENQQSTIASSFARQNKIVYRKETIFLFTIWETMYLYSQHCSY